VRAIDLRPRHVVEVDVVDVDRVASPRYRLVTLEVAQVTVIFGQIRPFAVSIGCDEWSAMKVIHIDEMATMQPSTDLFHLYGRIA
jgi:hypothetical protein